MPDPAAISLVRDAAVIGVLQVYLTYCLFLFINGITNREYVSFFLFASAYGLYFVLKSPLLRFFAGSSFPAAVGALHSLYPAAALFFIASTFNREVRGHLLAAVSMWCALALAGVFFPGLERFRLPVALYSALLAAAMWNDAARCGFHESLPALVGVCSFSAGITLAAAGDLGLVSFPLWGEDLLVFVFCVSVKYGLIMRYARYYREVKRLSGRILSAQEEERKRVSREIHDRVGQALIALKLNLQLAAGRDGDCGDRAGIERVVAGLSEAIGEVRRIVAGLRPFPRDDFGLLDAIAVRAGELRERFGLRVRVEAADGLNREVSAPEVKENLYRICQEALSNVLRHAGADEVVISLERLGRGLLLEISDNGTGMDRRKAAASSGIGLSTMRERAEMLNGTFAVEGCRGKGTTVRVTVPL